MVAQAYNLSFQVAEAGDPSERHEVAPGGEVRLLPYSKYRTVLSSRQIDAGGGDCRVCYMMFPVLTKAGHTSMLRFTQELL